MGSGMRYDQFTERLQELKEDFKKFYGREIETMAEFDVYLKQRKIRSLGRRNLTSLKGLDL
ncbi:hypothetical protein LCGC14_2792340 [marine sediment metagenome]|uniref:Uncharacterized protein n=1 Tax=marine sediment metagenome TaxID=412755 RepID=A0A0F9BGJ6_9ZZZZ